MVCSLRLPSHSEPASRAPLSRQVLDEEDEDGLGLGEGAETPDMEVRTPLGRPCSGCTSINRRWRAPGTPPELPGALCPSPPLLCLH